MLQDIFIEQTVKKEDKPMPAMNPGMGGMDGMM